MVEIEGVCGPATFTRLPAALAALWGSLRLLPLGSVQIAALRYVLAHPGADRVVTAALRRNGSLSIAFRMNGRLHSVHIRRAERPPD